MTSKWARTVMTSQTLTKKSTRLKSSNKIHTCQRYLKRVLNLLWDGHSTYGLVATLLQSVQFANFHIFVQSEREKIFSLRDL